MDLVSDAGVDVSLWALSKEGPVKHPAANPAYCYNWAFVQRGVTVVVNLWHEHVEELSGQLFCHLNPRRWAAEARESPMLRPSQRSAASRRATAIDDAIRYAYENELPLRVILGSGRIQDLHDPEFSKAGNMQKRILDPQPWSVSHYDTITGDCRLYRGPVIRYVDQFLVQEAGLPKKRETSISSWMRDDTVRTAVLNRAAGRCEYCGETGFETANGSIYLETHHIIPLSEGGSDNTLNVIAVCPNDHRRAHHADDRDRMRHRMLEILKQFGHDLHHGRDVGFRLHPKIKERSASASAVQRVPQSAPRRGRG